MHPPLPMRNNIPVAQPQPAVEDVLRDFRLGRNPEDSFRALFTHFYPQVYRFFVRKGLSPEDSKDLTQEVFFSVYKGLRDIQNETQFASWLFTIARNTFTNELEKRHAKKRSGIQVVRTQDSGEDTDLDHLPARAATDSLQHVLDREKTEKLAAALQTLPPQMRRCVQLRVAEDSTYEEIALVLGISVNTVKAHLHKARKTLQERLASYFAVGELLNPEDR
jgi:RNA polymerase sigma-70 factor, ECF subfamily